MLPSHLSFPSRNEQSGLSLTSKQAHNRIRIHTDTHKHPGQAVESLTSFTLCLYNDSPKNRLHTHCLSPLKCTKTHKCSYFCCFYITHFKAESIFKWKLHLYVWYTCYFLTNKLLKCLKSKETKFLLQTTWHSSSSAVKCCKHYSVYLLVDCQHSLFFEVLNKLLYF